MTPGYSGTPLARKLTLRDGMRFWTHAMPESVAAEIADVGLRREATLSAGLEAGHIFVTERAELARLLALVRPLLAPAGQLWVSWPKKAAKVETDVTEDVVRIEALPLGYVDVKVCAVDQIWSGLKLVIRKMLR